MVNPNHIQEGLLLKLQGVAAVTALLSASTQIKEDQWQGTTFTYPAVRIDLGTLMPVADCEDVTCDFGIECFSEKDSSHEANNVAYQVNQALHGKSFESGNARFMIYSRGLIPAKRSEERAWRSVALFKSRISPTS